MRDVIMTMCLMLIIGPTLNVGALEDVASKIEYINLEDGIRLFESEAAALRTKLVNPEDIIGPLEQGAETVKVIVNLVEPPEIDRSADGRSPDSLKDLRDQIAAIQAVVFSGLSVNDFKLRHRYHNFASFSGEVAPEGLAKLLNDPLVESIEPVYLRQLQLRQGINLINGTPYRSRYSGAGVAIAICDTGVDYTHPKLGGRAFPNNSKVIDGNDIADKDHNPMPGNMEKSYHGTACAGIAGGDLPDSGENTDQYIGGVAYDAKLYTLKITRNNDPNQQASDEDIIKAWDWCVDHKDADPEHPIKVISTSFGGGRYTMPADDVKTETWESEVNFTLFQVHRMWKTSASAPWGWDQREKHSGTYSMRAARISQGQYSAIAVTLYCEEGDIEFFYKVSSRPERDGLAFYIDRHQKKFWSGEVDWPENPFSYPVTEGEHEFLWAYIKNATGSVGQDTAWIDDITFPVQSSSLAYPRVVNEAIASGITVVAASGNDGYCDAIGCPAALSNVISVGAVWDADLVGYDDADNRVSYERDSVTYYSNSASILDILAPSHNAYTTDIVGTKGACDGIKCGSGVYNYNPYFGGTSAACPYVAGAVACLQQAAYENMQERYLLPSEVKAILVATGDLVTDPKAPDITKPRLNLGWAIDNIPGLGTSAVVFNDTFPTTNTATWTLYGATVDGVGRNEPSGIYSLHLGGGDSATKEPIDLSSYTRAVLTYRYQRKGGGNSPGGGQDLIFEYRDGFDWVELDRQRSEGSDMTKYGFGVGRVPAEALHSDFRLRVRSAASTDGVRGDWFVDDVTVKAR